MDKTVLYPGSFKPPHIGHFTLAKYFLKYGYKIKIIISKKPRENINSTQSLRIWELYNKLLGNVLELIISNDSPILYVINEVKSNPKNKYILLYGKNKDGRFEYLSKYPNVEIFNAGNISNINATDFRKALREGSNIKHFLPKISPKMFQKELHKDKFLIIDKLIEYCCNDLNIHKPNKVKIITSPSYTKKYKSFGGYIPEQRIINLVIVGRNLADCCRSLCHEIYHMYQDDNNLLNNSSGEDGSLHENEANSYSGKIMRQFGRENPEIYNLKF